MQLFFVSLSLTTDKILQMRTEKKNDDYDKKKKINIV